MLSAVLLPVCPLQTEHHALWHLGSSTCFTPGLLQEYFLGRGGMFGLLPALTGESLPGARPVVAEVHHSTTARHPVIAGLDWPQRILQWRLPCALPFWWAEVTLSLAYRATCCAGDPSCSASRRRWCAPSGRTPTAAMCPASSSCWTCTGAPCAVKVNAQPRSSGCVSNSGGQGCCWTGLCTQGGTAKCHVVSSCHLLQGGRAVRGGAHAQRGGGHHRGALPAAGAGGGATRGGTRIPPPHHVPPRLREGALQSAALAIVLKRTHRSHQPSCQSVQGPRGVQADVACT
jgi:hypothetical protein